jgi:hypothetical protein
MSILSLNQFFILSYLNTEKKDKKKAQITPSTKVLVFIKVRIQCYNTGRSTILLSRH